MTTEPESEPTVRTYLAILRQQRWWVAGAAALGLAAGLGLSATQPNRYSATAQVLVQPSGMSLVTGSAGQRVTSTDVQTETQLVTSAPVREAVRKKLGRAPSVSVSQVAHTNMISIAATSESPAGSATVANAYARAFVAHERAVTISNVTAAEKQLRSQISSLDRQVKAHKPRAGAGSAAAAQAQSQVTALLNQEAALKEQLAQVQVNGAVATGTVELVTPAQPPTGPSSPNPVQDAVLGLAVGVLAGLAIAFLRNNLNDSLRSKEAVEQLAGRPVLAMVPAVASWRKRDRPMVVSLSEPTSPAAESYRSLRTSLQFLRHERELRTLVVTSPNSAEGKTATLANLGAAFAQAGERVALLSCDLRRPRLGTFFGLEEKVGMTSVLLGRHTLEEALRPVPGHANLWALPSGELPPNPAELLGGTAVRDLIARLRGTFDLVLIDSPPALPVTDTAVLSAAADATLLVAAAGQTRRGELARAAEQLHQVRAAVVGVVLNKVTKQAGYGYGYGYGYSYKPYLPRVAGQGAASSNGKAAPADVGSHD